MMQHCIRCGGSVLSQRFIEVYGRGVRWGCLACGEAVEQVEGEELPSQAELQAIFAAERERLRMPA
jgi:hypothetical protein